MYIPITRYLTWLVLFGALVLWAGVGYFAWVIAEAAEAHSSRIATMETEEQEHATALELHALSRDTRDARARLEQLSDPDILEIYDTLETLSKDTGIAVQIGAPSVAPAQGPSVHAVAFIIEAQGTFAQVSHLISLLESFPIPSMLDEMQVGLAVAPEGSKAPRKWHIIAEMRIFTTADIPAL